MAETEVGRVEGVDELSDPADPFLEIGDPPAQLAARKISIAQAFGYRIGGQFSRLQRKVDSGRIRSDR